MNKTAIKNFAKWARNKLITDIKENIITFKGVDMLDNTPILDIKKVFK